MSDHDGQDGHVLVHHPDLPHRAPRKVTAAKAEILANSGWKTGEPAAEATPAAAPAGEPRPARRAGTTSEENS